MIRKGSEVLAAALVLVALGVGTATAAPEGPRLAIQRFDLHSKRSGLFTVDPSGSAEAVVRETSVGRRSFLFVLVPPSWSPDGSRLAFTTLTQRRGGPSSTDTGIDLVGVDGGPAARVAGTRNGYGPVFSPDGSRLAYAKTRRRYRHGKNGGSREVYSSTSIWLLDLSSGRNRQLTPWRNGLAQVPSSFSPDGSRLAFTRFAGHKPPEALAMAFDGSATAVLARDALEPVYSPDGSRIAFLRGPVKTRAIGRSKITVRLTDLYTVRTGGGELRRLTRTGATTELAPSWDPSGQRLAYTAMRPFASEESSLGFGDQIREINADGTCSTEVLSSPQSAFYGAAWQPGPGREAGPISC